MFLEILAQAAEATTEVPNKQYVDIPFIWEQIITLSWLQALVAVSFGVVYLMYGWRIFRILVVIAFAMIGLYLGMAAAVRLDGSLLWGGVFGLAIMAGVSIPAMKWCVCILGAVAGGIVSGGLWYAFEQLPEVYIWAGFLVGAVAGGMISFIVLKAAVMLFTSMGGSAICVIGILSLLYHYEKEVNQLAETDTAIYHYVHDVSWFLPVALIIPTIIGIIMQNKFIKQSKNWELTKVKG